MESAAKAEFAQVNWEFGALREKIAELPAIPELIDILKDIIDLIEVKTNG